MLTIGFLLSIRYHCKVLVVSDNPEGRATAPLPILRRRDAENLLEVLREIFLSVEADHVGNLGHRQIFSYY